MVACIYLSFISHLMLLVWVMLHVAKTNFPELMWTIIFYYNNSTKYFMLRIPSHKFNLGWNEWHELFSFYNCKSYDQWERWKFWQSFTSIEISGERQKHQSYFYQCIDTSLSPQVPVLLGVRNLLNNKTSLLCNDAGVI